MSGGLVPGSGNAGALRVRLTGLLMARQFGLMLVVATFMLAQIRFFDLYGQWGWDEIWRYHLAIREDVSVRAVYAFIYGGVLAIGLVFAAGPSERSFNVFLLAMLSLFGLIHYDHSILDWVLVIGPNVLVEQDNPVSPLKLLLAAGMFSGIVLMHYNILADDLTRRLLGRGLAADEVLPVRRHMLQLLWPIFGAATAIVIVLALVAEVGAFLFQARGLFPKLEIALLGVLGVAMGYLILQVLRGLYKARKAGQNG